MEREKIVPYHLEFGKGGASNESYKGREYGMLLF
jgi:hypothetical protein